MSCGSSGNGELVGVQQREFWNPTDPYGMVFIPQGSFVMGPSDQDVPFANVSASKRVSVSCLRRTSPTKILSGLILKLFTSRWPILTSPLFSAFGRMVLRGTQ